MQDEEVCGDFAFRSILTPNIVTNVNRIDFIAEHGRLGGRCLVGPNSSAGWHHRDQCRQRGTDHGRKRPGGKPLQAVTTFDIINNASVI